MIAEGHTLEEVAKLVSVSKRTVENWAVYANKKFRAESEKALQQGLETVRTKTHENVVAAANILNAHLKAVESTVNRDPAFALAITSTAAKDYATIASKEYDKLKSIDSGHTEQGKRHSTQVNILQIQKEIEESDIVNSATVFEIKPEQLGLEVEEEKPSVEEPLEDSGAND